MKLKDLSGNRYGSLVVAGRSESRYGLSRWIVACDCGQAGVVTGCALRDGKTRTCGRPTCRYHAALALAGVLPPNGSREAAIRQIWNIYRYKAKRKGREFSIDRQRFELLLFSPCRYCGSAPSNTARRDSAAGPVLYNGIDRLDSGKGYTEHNTVSCCGTCNTMKSALSVPVFMAHVRKICETQKAL